MENKSGLCFCVSVSHIWSIFVRVCRMCTTSYTVLKDVVRVYLYTTVPNRMGGGSVSRCPDRWVGETETGVLRGVTLTKEGEESD